MFEIRKRFEGQYFIFITDVTMSNFLFSSKKYRALALQKEDDGMSSFISVAPVGIVLALALLTCVLDTNAAKPKPATTANVAVTHSREIAS